MLNIPEERQHIFNSTAYMIERKLLDMQIFIIAHKQSLRSVCIEYKSSISNEELTIIEAGIHNIYNMLQVFADEYAVPKMQTTARNELMVKTNFFWEDLCGAISLRGYGHIDDAIIKDYTQKMNTMIDKANTIIDQLKND